jgi:hypothetical protein
MESLEQQKAYKIALEMEESDDPEFVRKNIPELLRLIEADVHHPLVNDVSGLYLGMAQNKCLARIERLSRVLKTIEEDEPMRIGEAEEHYANAVIPEPEGIKIAYAEGQAPGPVRSMIAFGKTLIGFKTENMQVDSIEYSSDDLRDGQKRNILCRHVSGDLRKEDIKYLIIRIPKNLVDLEVLTKEEVETESTFIFRGVEI